MNCLIVLSLFTEFSFHIYEVSAALAKNPLLLGMFDNTVGEKVMQLRSGEVLGEDWEEVNACDSRTSYILPRAARSIKGSFMFIVNQPAQDKLSQVCYHMSYKTQKIIFRLLDVGLGIFTATVN